MTESKYYAGIRDQLEEAKTQSKNVTTHALRVIEGGLEFDKEFLDDLLLEGELEKIRLLMDQVKQIINQ